MDWLREYRPAIVALAVVFAVFLVGALVVSCGSKSSDSHCSEALDAAEVVIGKSNDALGLVSDAIDGYMAGDGQAMFKANDQLNRLADTVDEDVRDYRRLADECRSGS